jgi:hypothetical protein
MASVREEAVEFIAERLRGNILNDENLTAWILNVTDDSGLTVLILSVSASVQVVNPQTLHA